MLQLPHRGAARLHVPGGLSGDSRLPLLLTCEHASAELPAPWSWSAEDEWLVSTHWAIDIGAAELATELADVLGVPAVLARFSRLFVDPNRDESSPELIRKDAEGRPVMLNLDVGSSERERRIEYWLGYHAGVDAVASHARQRGAKLLFGVHTFTDYYEGQARTLEVGVLFDEDEELAERIRAAFAADGWQVALNEPYSGKEGLIYAVDRHARAHGLRAIEVELRQDLAANPAQRARFVRVLRSCLPL